LLLTNCAKLIHHLVKQNSQWPNLQSHLTNTKYRRKNNWNATADEGKFIVWPISMAYKHQMTFTTSITFILHKFVASNSSFFFQNLLYFFKYNHLTTLPSQFNLNRSVWWGWRIQDDYKQKWSQHTQPTTMIVTYPSNTESLYLRQDGEPYFLKTGQTLNYLE
jgi:hypothetical protein